MNELGITLKKLRESRNLTIKKLSIMANIGRGTVGDIETGRNNTTIKTLEKISNVLNLNEKERVELFAAFVPKDIGIKIFPKHKNLNSKLNSLIEEATLIFNDKTIEEKDKEKLIFTLQEVFFVARQKNKKI